MNVRTIFQTVILSAFLGLAGCQNSPSTFPLVEGYSAEMTPFGNFIMGSPEIAAWGAEYTPGNSYAMVNIPIAGAIKIEYAVKRGWGGDIFLSTAAPVEVEIGLKTLEGTVDEVTSICVTYEEQRAFAAIPSTASEDIHEQWTHYRRTDEANSEFWPWWPLGAGFVFGGETRTTCVIQDGRVEVDAVDGPFPKPSAGTAFLTAAISVPAPGTLEDLYEVALVEPDISVTQAYVESGVLNVPQTGTTAVLAPTVPPMAFSVPIGKPLSGVYTFQLNNADWTSPGCPGTVAVKLALRTQSVTRIVTCAIPCGSVAQIDLLFPAGTVAVQPASAGMCS